MQGTPSRPIGCIMLKDLSVAIYFSGSEAAHSPSATITLIRRTLVWWECYCRLLVLVPFYIKVLSWKVSPINPRSPPVSLARLVAEMPLFCSAFTSNGKIPRSTTVRKAAFSGGFNDVNVFL